MSFEKSQQARKKELEKGRFDKIMEGGGLPKDVVTEKEEQESKETSEISFNVPQAPKREKRISKSYYLKESSIKKIDKLTKQYGYSTPSSLLESVIESLK